MNAVQQELWKIGKMAYRQGTVDGVESVAEAFDIVNMKDAAEMVRNMLTAMLEIHDQKVKDFE